MYSNVFQYDGNGKLSEISYTVDNALLEKRLFKYSGNKTEISIFDQGNNLSFRQENSHNDKGLLISEIRTGGKGNVIHSLDMQYNASDNLMEEVRKRAEDKLDYKKIYHYDRDNRLVKVETVTIDGATFVSHEYQYNPAGDLILETWKKSERAQESSSKKFTYDSKGLYTEEDCYYATYKLKSLYKYTYEFH